MEDKTINYATMRRCVHHRFNEYIRQNDELVYEMFKDFKNGDVIDDITRKFLTKIILLCMDRSPVYCPTYRSEWTEQEFLKDIFVLVDDENNRRERAKAYHKELIEKDKKKAKNKSNSMEDEETKKILNFLHNDTY